MRGLRAIICFWCLSNSLCGPVWSAPSDYLEPKLLSGSIYDKPDGRLLFTFRRTATQTGDVVYVLREFRDTNGTLAAQERVQYQRGRLVRFELDEKQIGASGYALVKPVDNQRQQINFQYTGRASQGAKMKQSVETVRGDVLISDTLPGFLADHWDELSRGVAPRFRFIVVPRQETIGFKVSRESDTEFHGRKAVRIKMEPVSWIISKALDPLIFTVEADPPHRVLQYWGRTTPRVPVGDALREVEVLSVFDWK
jgi:hypothetical protein